VRVVIADDSMLVREGLARLLTEAGCEVVGTAENALELLRQVVHNQPDVAIVDIKMPPTHTDEGIAAAQEIRALQYIARFVCGDIFQALQYGIRRIGTLSHDSRRLNCASRSTKAIAWAPENCQ
jgi:DNA-binding NarL/FixJ family response regulator